LINEYCPTVSTFRCQERINRYPGYFTCGDGQYLAVSIISIPESYCTNNRDKEFSRMMLTSFDHISDRDCQQSFYCALHSNRRISTGKNDSIEFLADSFHFQHYFICVFGR
jgi:hypothetical protein